MHLGSMHQQYHPHYSQSIIRKYKGRRAELKMNFEREGGGGTLWQFLEISKIRNRGEGGGGREKLAPLPKENEAFGS